MEFFKPENVIPLGCGQDIVREQQIISLSSTGITTLQSDVCGGKVCFMVDPEGNPVTECENLKHTQNITDATRSELENRLLS